MKPKKWLAALVAIALVAVPVQVALADGLTGQVVTGDAIVDYIDPSSIISIVVPTSSALAFTLDPQNLAATQGVGTWNPSQGGSIIPAAVNIMVNESAVPIKTTVHFTLTDAATNKAVLLDKADDVNAGTTKNMFLSFVPSKSKATIDKVKIDATTAPTFVKNAAGDADATFNKADLQAAGVKAADLVATADAATATFGQFVETVADSGIYNQVEVPAHGDIAATTQTTVAEYTDATSGLEDATSAAVLTDATAGVDLAYALNRADYYVIKGNGTYNMVLDDAASNSNYDTASFIISGVINKNADWSGYTAQKKISVSASYSFEIMSADAYTTAKAAALGASYNTIAPSPRVSSVAVSPDTATVTKGLTKDFTATVTGANGASQTVAWSVTGGSSTDTAINSSGKLTVGSDETATSLTVTATAADDHSKTGTATVTVAEPAPTVSNVAVAPGTPTVIKGNTQAFTATVTGAHSPAQTVNWSVTGGISGTSIDSSGVLTVAAGETATSLTVTATSTVDNTKSGTSTVTVTDPAPTVSTVSVSPGSPSVVKGNTQTFTASVTGAHNPAQTVTWSVTGGISGTSIDNSGVLTVAAGETATSLTVTATSTVDNSKSGTSTVTVTDPAPTVSSVSVSPATPSVTKGNTQTFTATVTGSHSPAQTVTWSVSGGISGTSINSSGVLTVASGETATSLTVTATSTVDNTKSGTATVTVTAPAPTVSSVSVSPSTASVVKGATQTFTATVTGTNSPAQTVTWSVTGKTSASTAITSGGVLTVGSDETAASLTVTATSTVDNTKSGSATVTVANVALTNGTPLASLTVTKAQCTAGYRILLKNSNGSFPTGTISSAYWAATATNDVKSALTYTSSTGIVLLPTSAWSAYADYTAKIVITMSTGEVFTITSFFYDAP